MILTSTDMISASEAIPGRGAIPLVVDLDGTLLWSDLLIETAFATIGNSAAQLAETLRQWMKGRAQLKEFLANAGITPTSLPYDPAILLKARTAAQAGRPVYLASGSDEKLVRRIAEHLGFFSGWFASNGRINLTGEAKACRLVEAFGPAGFDYVGNDVADLPVWRVCRKRLAIRVSQQVRRRLIAIDPETEFLPNDRTSVQTWARLLRVHQYAKNALVLVPVLTSHNFSVSAILNAVVAMIAFSLCASGVYIINDLVDLGPDRGHPSKLRRPLASGAVPLIYGLLLIPFLITAAMALAASISLLFLSVLGCYFLMTTAYTFFLKRKAIADVMVLATLYTLRVVAGGVAIDVPTSEWLLGFSIFMFMALALIKRYVELSQRLKLSLPDPGNRNYKSSDLPVLGALAAASGFNAITLFALYLSSDVVPKLYRHPQFLWLMCPLLLYWVSRALMMAHRDAMHDDPIVFALQDRVSRIMIVLMVALVLISI